MADLLVDKRRVAPLHRAQVRNIIASDAGEVGDIVKVAPDFGARRAGADTPENAVVLGIVTAVGCEGAMSYGPGDAISVVVHGQVCGVRAVAPGPVFLSNTPGKLADVAGVVRRVVGQMIHPDILLVQPVLG